MAWLETCAITCAPIVEDEPVVLIIYKNDKHTSWNGPWVLHTDIKLIQKGTYDTYGGIKEVETDSRTSIFIKLKVWNTVQKIMAKEPFNHGWLFIKEKAKFDEKLYYEFVRVLVFCSRSRVDITRGIAFKGSQNHRAEYLDQVMTLMDSVFQDVVDSQPVSEDEDDEE